MSGTHTCMQAKHSEKRKEENEKPGVVVPINSAFRSQRQEDLHVIMKFKASLGNMKTTTKY